MSADEHWACLAANHVVVKKILRREVRWTLDREADDVVSVKTLTATSGPVEQQVQAATLGTAARKSQRILVHRLFDR